MTATPHGGGVANRWRALVALLSVMSVVVAACGTGGGGTVSSGGTTQDKVPVDQVERAAQQLPVTVTSADGREVTVTDTSRIVPLWGDVTEIIFGLGMGDSVVGRDSSATFEGANDLPMVTRGHEVSAESVLSLRPTIVIADSETGPSEALEHIRNVGIPVLVFERATRVEEIGTRIRLVAEALGVPEAGDALAERTRAEIDAVAAGLDEMGGTRPRVAFLYLRGSAGIYLMGGPGSGSDSMIEAAGGVDAGTEMGLERAFTPVTSEAVVAAQPDVILVTTTGLQSVGGIDGLREVPGVAQTPAARNGRVVAIEDGLLFSFGSRTPAALRQLAEGLRADL